MSNKKDKAFRWDKIYKKRAHWEKGFSKEVLEFSKYLRKGDRVLDAGCGSGRSSIFLAREGFEVWGVDISKEGIKKAKNKIQLKTLHFLVGDIENLPFKKGFFDAVYSESVLNFVPLEKAASEIFRVLKKGGVAFIWLLLNIKIISTGKIRKFYNKEDIISVYRKKFKILEQKDFTRKDLKAENPHTHKMFVIILKK